jgi:hypothetical protein
MHVQEIIKNEKKVNIFDQIFMTSTKCRYARRKVSEALRRVRDWFNRSMVTGESVPSEFQNLGIKNQCRHKEETELWNLKIQI